MRVEYRHYSGSSLCGATLDGAENNEAALDGAPFDRADLTFGTCNDGGLLGGDGKGPSTRASNPGITVGVLCAALLWTGPKITKLLWTVHRLTGRI